MGFRKKGRRGVQIIGDLDGGDSIADESKRSSSADTERGSLVTEEESHLESTPLPADWSFHEYGQADEVKIRIVGIRSASEIAAETSPAPNTARWGSSRKNRATNELKRATPSNKIGKRPINVDNESSAAPSCPMWFRPPTTPKLEPVPEKVVKTYKPRQENGRQTPLPEIMAMSEHLGPKEFPGSSPFADHAEQNAYQEIEFPFAASAAQVEPNFQEQHDEENKEEDDFAQFASATKNIFSTSSTDQESFELVENVASLRWEVLPHSPPPNGVSARRSRIDRPNVTNQSPAPTLSNPAPKPQRRQQQVPQHPQQYERPQYVAPSSIVFSKPVEEFSLVGQAYDMNLFY